MNPTDKKAFSRVFKKVWPMTKLSVFNRSQVRDAMEVMWEECKEHYEKEYCIPKAEGRL